MKQNTSRGTFGFTLIEIILLLVFAGLISSMTLSYFISGASTSNKPVDRLAASALLNKAMEIIVKDYNANITKNEAGINTLAGKINKCGTNEDTTDYCSGCTGKVEKVTVGPLTDSRLLTLTRNGENIYHVFTVQE